MECTDLKENIFWFFQQWTRCKMHKNNLFLRFAKFLIMYMCACLYECGSCGGQKRVPDLFQQNVPTGCGYSQRLKEDAAAVICGFEVSNMRAGQQIQILCKNNTFFEPLNHLYTNQFWHYLPVFFLLFKQDPVCLHIKETSLGILL